jgi:hypothetical protein
MDDLFGGLPDMEKRFDGETYDPKRDGERLSGQLERVYHLMKDGKWRTLAMIASDAEGTEASVSARLRDLRKSKYGRHVVLRRHIRGGLWQYKLEKQED